MTENKRFKSLILAIHDFQGSTYDLTLQGGVNALCNLINGLNNKSNRLEKENEQLKSELKIYRKVADCGNCKYHNYDWFDGGDEFEVCEKENDMKYYICEDWEEL